VEVSKGIITLIAISLLLTNGVLAEDLLVVGELCTSTTCGPCRNANLELDDLSQQLGRMLVLVRYHGWWPSPGNDPFYLYNQSQNRARFNYYGVNYVPHFFIDGNIDGESDVSSWYSLIVAEGRNFSPLAMNIDGIYDPDGLAGQFTVTIYAESDPGLSNLKLRVALTESDIHYSAPNGLNIHNQTFRNMFPSTSGQAVSISEGDSVEYTFDFTTPDPIVPDNSMLVAFVQSDQNKHILQGARIAIPDMTQTGTEDEIEIPEVIALEQNYPNPFNAETKIDFRADGGAVSLQVYDLTGALVKTLVDGSFEAGYHSVVWDGLDENGNEAASGVYFYRLSGSDGEHIKRMTLLK
jgi:hypothetical protein